MSKEPFSEDALPPMETIAWLIHSPGSDYPSGKWFDMEFVKHTLYERVVEEETIYI